MSEMCKPNGTFFTMQLREAVEWCIPKKVMSERKKYPVPLNVKTRAKIRRKIDCGRNIF